MDFFGDSYSLGAALNPITMADFLSGEVSVILEDSFPKWKSSKIAAQSGKFKTLYNKIWTTCNKSPKATWDCEAVVKEEMRIPSGLNELGQIRFFLLNVSDLILEQWYEDADSRTKAKGQKALDKLTKLTDKLLSYNARLYGPVRN